MLGLFEIPWQHRGEATLNEGAVHATYNIIAMGDPCLAQQLHSKKDVSPFSAYLRDGVLRLGVLTEQLVRLIAATDVGRSAISLRLDDFDVILKRAGTCRQAKVEFVTPIALGGFNDRSALPDPAWVFGSLVTRWRKFGGPVIPDLRYDDVSLYCAELRMTHVAMTQYGQRGFTGYAGYLFPADVAHWYQALLLFASYSGIGRKTTHGLGQVYVTSK